MMDHHNHGDMDMGECSMNMLFTFSTKNLCIVFPQWRVTGLLSLLLSLAAVVLLVAGYEGLRDFTRQYELATLGQRDLPSTRTGRGSAAERKGKVTRAALYAAQVFYSFFIMLLFMTYNGWVMLAVAAGAFIGHLMFGESSASKTVSCH
ncbi:ctr copper transporter [Nannizzia gypsea CBS 118893]|uniref:Copper transport protein n=1 Tax=Arthroderma gypseum (strain ATCC MYA-4604 / CBS 118893) TaxID=535722 RepID=E4V2Q1_ARTGP|nr:ctr copper transporter [Nannizzia gypsea CBS 118893]EFR03613.1 ctr copper transporter [Nannizzia gypsea CBS 118893]